MSKMETDLKKIIKLVLPKIKDGLRIYQKYFITPCCDKICGMMKDKKRITSIAIIVSAIASIALFLATAMLGAYTNKMSLATNKLAEFEKYKTTPYMDVKVNSIGYIYNRQRDKKSLTSINYSKEFIGNVCIQCFLRY